MWKSSYKFFLHDYRLNAQVTYRALSEPKISCTF